MADPTIVLIHGLWMTPRSWEHVQARYEQRGHTVLAPSWPGLEGDVEAIRADPSPLASLSITKVVDHYATIVRGLDAPPIIIGHSFGGLFTQLLVDRGLGCAAVGVEAAPPRGVRRLPLSTIHSAWPILRNPANRHRAVPYTLEHFHYTMTNTLSLEESRPLYERYAIPAAGGILWEGAMAEMDPKTAARVDYHRDDRAPLLFVAGGKDHVVPASVNKVNVHRYHASTAITDFRLYPDRPHFTLGVDGWEAVADMMLDWALDKGRSTR